MAKRPSPGMNVANQAAEVVGQVLGRAAAVVDSLKAEHPHPIDEAAEALSAVEKAVESRVATATETGKAVIASAVSKAKDAAATARRAAAAAPTAPTAAATVRKLAADAAAKARAVVSRISASASRPSRPASGTTKPAAGKSSASAAKSSSKPASRPAQKAAAKPVAKPGSKPAPRQAANLIPSRRGQTKLPASKTGAERTAPRGSAQPKSRPVAPRASARTGRAQSGKRR